MLFLMAAGLTLILGVMNFVNLAHSSFYMLGAFFAAALTPRVGFALALVGSLVGVGAVGLVVEIGIARRLYERSHLDQVLCTFGMLFVVNDAALTLFGPRPLGLSVPAALSGSIQLLGAPYPIYRLLIIAVGLSVGWLLHFLIMKTRIGMLIRAGATDRAMLGALGVAVGPVFAAIFVFGAVLAGLAGVLAGPLLSVSIGMGDNVMILALVVIVIGGVGSTRGALYAAIIVGMMDTFGRFFLPPVLATILIYIVMAAVLIFRPAGLFGRGGHLAESASSSSVLASPSPQRRRILIICAAVVLFVLFIVPLALELSGNLFFIRLATRLLIFAIAALSLDLILGLAGIASFGHAAFIGVSAYTIGILSYHATNEVPLVLGPIQLTGTVDPAVAWPAAIVMSALTALVVGALSLRTNGLALIMITLAFAQMLFYMASAPGPYGGDDGMQLSHSIRVVNSRVGIYWLTLGLLATLLLTSWSLANSRFGMVLQAIRQNERRVAAVGISAYRYKLLAFVVAGAIAGIAGVLNADTQLYVSPSDLSWARSGELLIMTVIGGVGTLIGPVIGAIGYLGLQSAFSDSTEHWQAFFGCALILFVLAFRSGGLISRIVGRI